MCRFSAGVFCDLSQCCQLSGFLGFMSSCWFAVVIATSPYTLWEDEFASFSKDTGHCMNVCICQHRL